MESEFKENEISISLSREEALVFLEWLYTFNETSKKRYFNDQAEQRILWDLEAILESKVPEIFSKKYSDALKKARDAVRDEE